MITRTVLTPQQYAELSAFVKHNDLVMDLVAGGATLTVEQQIEHTNKMADFVKSLAPYCDDDATILEWRLCNNSVLLATWKGPVSLSPLEMAARAVSPKLPDPSRVLYITPDRIDVILRPDESAMKLAHSEEIASYIPTDWPAYSHQVVSGVGGPRLAIRRKGE